MRVHTSRCAAYLLLLFHPIANHGFGVLRQSPQRIARTELSSTPFEADMYSDNPFEKQVSSLAQPPDTQLVLGINKYTHDTTICAANAETGEVLFALSKERLTRKKHDAGNVADLVESCLDSLDLDIDSIKTVVMNNHHHRVLPLEKDPEHLQWESGLNINGGGETGYEDEENLLIQAQRVELSHHLAHAYSVAAQAPFDHGMIVVMDGMGETYRTMLRSKITKDASYFSDLDFPEGSFQCIPSNIRDASAISHFDFREAESVYVFQKTNDSMSLKPIFKRFTQENSPPTLYNHGFENMDSVGALYSRASSHVFGDWNACGKLMGLAPWIEHSWEKGTIVPKREKEPIMSGSLYSEESDKAFTKNLDLLTGTPFISRMDADLFDDKAEMQRVRRYDFDDDSDENEILAMKLNQKTGEMEDADDQKKRLPKQVALDAISLAARIQTDLEDVVIDMVEHFKEQTGESNLCVAGGVALNSVLNGKLSRDLGFEETFIPPYPGDDGVAVGCCAFALYGNKELETEKRIDRVHSPSLWNAPLPPYLGPDRSEVEIRTALEAAAPWVEFEAVRDTNRRIDFVVEEIASGGVVAWFQGRSELGPRALGHRSILADPRKKGLVRFINEHVKNRESFRPFAPSVLAEYAADWFDLGDSNSVQNSGNASPYMSLTAMVKEDRERFIPAVTHCDGSSRLQTLTKDAEPLYHQLISKFHDLTGVPMVLNTSFNTLPGEPIVETPTDAIRSFLCSMGALEVLVIGDYVVRRKEPNVKELLGLATKKGEVLKEPVQPKRAGPAIFKSSFDLEESPDEDAETSPKTLVQMPARLMHNANDGGWYELLDELETEILMACDGRRTITDIMGMYMPDEDQKEEYGQEFIEQTDKLLQNVAARLVHLQEHTLISW